MATPDDVRFSLVIPVYKNEANVHDLIEAIDNSIASLVTAPFEVVFVVDGSPDRSRDLLYGLLDKQRWASRLIVLSRNFGAAAAIRTGLSFATGQATAVLAADLQDPASLVPRLWDILSRDEADVVYCERVGRDDGLVAALTSRLYWWSYRKTAFPDAPKGGASMYAFNARVRDAILGMSALPESMFSLVMWAGFRRKSVPYVRRPRSAGRSGYTFSRKLAYALDSLIFISDLPILFQVWISLAGSAMTALIGVP